MMVPRSITTLRRLIGRTWRNDSGVSSVEFVICAPLFFIIFMSTVEAGVLLTRKVMLERGVDLATRTIRLGLAPAITHDQFKELICANTVGLGGCANVIMLELRPINTTTWSPLNQTASCVDRSEEVQPVTEFRLGVESELMLVRACMLADAVFPLTGLGLHLPKDAQGGYRLIATSAFVNEPR